MANFNGRRAPNFAQYLDDLNAIPSPYDQAVQQRQQENTFNLDEELALFTNTEFFDFEKFTDLGLPNFDAVDQKSSPVESIADQATQNADMKFLEFLNGKSLRVYYVGFYWSRSMVGHFPLRRHKGTAFRLGHTISNGLVDGHRSIRIMHDGL
jgi:hypothetical protein